MWQWSNYLFSSSGLFSWIQTYLAGGEIIMLSHSKRGIHEYLRHGGQVFNTQHLQPKEVSVYGLSMDCLRNKSSMCRSEIYQVVPEKSKHFCIHQNQSSHCTCSPCVSEQSSGAAPASLFSVENIYCLVRWLMSLKGTVHQKLKSQYLVTLTLMKNWV